MDLTPGGKLSVISRLRLLRVQRTHNLPGTECTDSARDNLSLLAGFTALLANIIFYVNKLSSRDKRES
jgi:hypothetical protein